MTTDVSALVPPSDPEAERWVLGSVLLQPDQLVELTGIVSAADFYVEAHRRLFETMVEMHNARDRIDVGLVVRRLEADGNLQLVGGPAFLAELATGIPTTRHAEHYAAIVRQKAQLRGLADLGHDLVRRAYEPGADPDALLGDVASDLVRIPSGSRGDNPEAVAEVMPRLVERIDATGQSGKLAGLHTGLSDFDKALGGLFASELTILAARPSQGKSALAGQIAAHVASQGKRVLVSSLEMSSEEWLQRALCADANVDSRRIRNGSLRSEDTKRLSDAAIRVGRWNLHLDDRTDQRVIDVRRRALRMKRDDLALLIIDYLTLLRPEDNRAPRHEQVAAMSRGLKLLAKELQVPILCLAQLNREIEGRESGSPQLSHLRESGAIEQDADVVMFLHQPDKTRDDYKELIVRKNRNGPIGKFGLDWDARRLTFTGCATTPDQPERRQRRTTRETETNPYANDFAGLGGN